MGELGRIGSELEEAFDVCKTAGMADLQQSEQVLWSSKNGHTGEAAWVKSSKAWGLRYPSYECNRLLL